MNLYYITTWLSICRPSNLAIENSKVDSVLRFASFQLHLLLMVKLKPTVNYLLGILRPIVTCMPRDAYAVPDLTLIYKLFNSMYYIIEHFLFSNIYSRVVVYRRVFLYQCSCTWVAYIDQIPQIDKILDALIYNRGRASTSRNRHSCSSLLDQYWWHVLTAHAHLIKAVEYLYHHVRLLIVMSPKWPKIPWWWGRYEALLIMLSRWAMA
jgi:hypothetical protein